MSNFASTIKIDDITSGRISSEEIFAEIERLKMEINNIRHDMTMFIKALADVKPGQSQLQYYQTIEERLKTMRQNIKDYYEQFYRLLPIINLSQIKLGHEVENVKDEKTKVPPTPNAKGTMNQPIIL